MRSLEHSQIQRHWIVSQFSNLKSVWICKHNKKNLVALQSTRSRSKNKNVQIMEVHDLGECVTCKDVKDVPYWCRASRQYHAKFWKFRYLSWKPAAFELLPITSNIKSQLISLLESNQSILKEFVRDWGVANRDNEIHWGQASASPHVILAHPGGHRAAQPAGRRTIPVARVARRARAPRAAARRGARGRPRRDRLADNEPGRKRYILGVMVRRLLRDAGAWGFCF